MEPVSKHDMEHTMYCILNFFQVYIDTHQKLPMNCALERIIVNGEGNIKFSSGQMKTYFCCKIESLLMGGGGVILKGYSRSGHSDR